MNLYNIRFVININMKQPWTKPSVELYEDVQMTLYEFIGICHQIAKTYNSYELPCNCVENEPVQKIIHTVIDPFVEFDIFFFGGSLDEWYVNGIYEQRCPLVSCIHRNAVY